MAHIAFELAYTVPVLNIARGLDTPHNKQFSNPPRHTQTVQVTKSVSTFLYQTSLNRHEIKTHLHLQYDFLFRFIFHNPEDISP